MIRTIRILKFSSVASLYFSEKFHVLEQTFVLRILVELSAMEVGTVVPQDRYQSGYRLGLIFFHS